MEALMNELRSMEWGYGLILSLIQVPYITFSQTGFLNLPASLYHLVVALTHEEPEARILSTIQ
jgi:hypothetical protein